MGREEIEREKMLKICQAHGWPEVPFDAYVSVHTITDGNVGVNKLRCTVESVCRDYVKDEHGYVAGPLDTFAKVRLAAPIPGAKYGKLIETVRVHHEAVEPIGPLDLMIEGISI